MRIGIDARLAYYQQAGITRYTLQLIEALARNDTEDEFHILQDSRNRTPILVHPSFVRRPVYTPAHHRLEQVTLPIEVSLMGLDLLHSPDFIPPLCRTCRSVITIHDLDFLLYPQTLTREAARYYGQIDQAVRRADAIIAVSHATKQDVIRLLGVPEHRVTVIYEAPSSFFRPLDDSTLGARVREEFGIDGEFMLFVSTIEPRKNVPTLLRAFRKLLDGYRADIKLVLAGRPGWLCEDVYQLVRELRLESDALFVGRVSDEQLLWLYNAARLLVWPSLYEGFGLPPLEAMACGTPVIVSNTSSLPEVVADAGLLVNPHDAEELTVAMWRLLTDDRLRQSLVEKGFRRAGSFSWDRAAKETLALYHSLA